MSHDGLFEESWIPLLPCYSWAGLLVWLLLVLGVIALVVSLYRDSRNGKRADRFVELRDPAPVKRLSREEQDDAT